MMEAYAVEQTKELFRIEIADDGSYFAVRDEVPLFCLQDKTISGACAKAERAFASWIGLYARS